MLFFPDSVYLNAWGTSVMGRFLAYLWAYMALPLRPCVSYRDSRVSIYLYIYLYLYGRRYVTLGHWLRDTLVGVEGGTHPPNLRWPQPDTDIKC